MGYAGTCVLLSILQRPTAAVMHGGTCRQCDVGGMNDAYAHAYIQPCHVVVRADSMIKSVYRSHCFHGPLLLCCCGTEEVCVIFQLLNVVFDGLWLSFSVNPTTVGVQNVLLVWAGPASIRV